MGPAAILHWTARTSGITSALVLLAFAFGGHEPLPLTASEVVAFLFFPVGVVVGFAIAWWREMAGGLVTVGSLALFYVAMLVLGEGRLGPYFLLFSAPGFLHIASALLARRAGSARPPARPGARDDGAG